MLPPSTPEADRRLRVFYDLARAIAQIQDTDALLGQILEAIIDVFGCERGVIGLPDPEGAPGSLRRMTRVRVDVAPGEVRISDTLIEAMIERRQSVIASEPRREGSPVEQKQKRKRKQKPKPKPKLLMAMGAPLILEARVLGFIYVDDHGDRDRFKKDDLDFLGALAHMTATALDNAERYQRMTAKIEILRSASRPEELLGDSPPMRELKDHIQKFAPEPRTPVLIQGESGAGKELVARTLHALSPRAGMPLVTLDCAATSETMIESELFGHAKGAFTDALTKKRGKFELANGGTLFLDEIGDLSLAAQAQVLRVVQEGKVVPLGSEETLKVDVRIISATHKDLEAEVAAKRFREDLFYRLNVLRLDVPPLRERGEDIPRLAQAFLEQAARKVGKRVAGFSPQALAALVRYPFPGNVRELRDEVERAVIVAEGGGEGEDAAVVALNDLSEHITGVSPPGPPAPRGERTPAEMRAGLEPQEKALLEEALERGRGSIAEAARLLGITRSMMRARMERFGLVGIDEGESN
jgi:Nif-specific regulatory protein